VALTEQRKLRRDIKTLLESVTRDFVDLTRLNPSPKEAAGIREHIRRCFADLKELRKSLDAVMKRDQGSAD
jgi:hypothetical protein